MSSLTLTLGAKNREKENNLKTRIENKKKMRKELSPLLATLTETLYRIYTRELDGAPKYSMFTLYMFYS